MKKSTLTNWLLVAVLIALMVVSFVVGSQKQTDGEEGFAGTDSVVTEMMEEDGVEPWFSPIFEPGSGELESGLFALQAGLGGIVFGFGIGVLYERNRRRKRETNSDALAVVTPDNVPASARNADEGA